MNVQELVEEAARSEADFYGIPLDVYAEMGAKERAAAKARHAKFARQVAKSSGKEPDAFVAIRRDDLQRIMDELNDARMGEMKSLDDGMSEDVADAAETNGVGSVEHVAAQVRPDYGGEEGGKHPRTLDDVYSYWPVGDGQHYVTVERKQPRSHNGVPCAGHLGKFSKRLSVRAFQERFGGREYELCVYGPDPSGRQDEITGEVSVKRLSKPFKITVPLLPPNLSAIPAMAGQGHDGDDMSYHPFANVQSSDSRLVEATAKTQREMFELGAKLGAVRSGPYDPTAYIGFARDSLEKSTETLRQQMDLAEARHKDEMARREADLRRRDDELRELRDELRRITGKTEGSSLQLVKELSEAGNSRAHEVRSHYETQMSDLRRSHSETVESMRQAFAEERKAQDQRVREREEDYRRMLDDANRKHDEEVRRLKDEIDRVRREERENGEARVREQKERTEERLRDQKESHERELRTMRENMETKATAQVAAKEMEIATTRDRLAQAKEEAERAKRDAEEGKDPVKVMEKAQKTAEALGYTKGDADPGPKTAGERLVSMLGVGIQGLMANPQTMEVVGQWLARDRAPAQGRPPMGAGAVQGGPAPRQLPAPAAQGGAQQPKRRVDMWGATGVTRRIEAGSAPAPAPSGASIQTPPVIPPPPPPQQEAQIAPAAPAPHPPAQEPEAPSVQAPVAPAAPGMPAFDNPFAALITNEQVLQMLVNLERAIDAGLQPDIFAQAVIQNFPEQAQALVTNFKPEQITEVTRSIPGGAVSSILRQDGKAFVKRVWQSIATKLGAQPEGAAS